MLTSSYSFSDYSSYLDSTGSWASTNAKYSMRTTAPDPPSENPSHATAIPRPFLFRVHPTSTSPSRGPPKSPSASQGSTTFEIFRRGASQLKLNWASLVKYGAESAG